MAEKQVTGYQKAFLRGDVALITRVLDTLPDYFAGLWERDFQSEERSMGMPFADTSYRCYYFKGTDDLPAARLWLMLQPTAAEVINIVPETPRHWMHGGLSLAEYGNILDAFLRMVQVAQEAARTTFEVYLTPAERTLTDALPADTAALFKVFATTANPSTGNLHPLDASRWHAFVISAHRYKAEVDSDFLRKWLSLNTEWYEEVIERVLTETESALELLNVYDAYQHAA